ncbi:MAG: hypothetical protein A3F82_03300 [Deltaproteobacteria bacterium RIFCSPLOWO2_12_FULL_44_12]|nr:MAG: hypothetical protein A2712_05280 [Deltaproteobacteria bacterium RIFCSPHIGHO2_01_FULL_43_49]OGQ14385.1 MAG: hypothetical protein A3D22_05105 [Deltaproteobacteria bacterium RIFCSPHIGHO2_02_FULL_44_53]OGQ27575.1 MAG: hypothetical protein A3D98_09070 [Deltaproteobacteria bacterium RIFCSPHIGHO2_12_FULL_44_21]OGQ30826.1 MAG: hypothetical protein A2979_01515 [Deltaproteobacteria bacterium RIFCSPLOWO2_01_FULL_45_74]OGQ42507.1 MAG: hypothetical protein A3I70_11040 [Deltaproteobacteria bacterium 
MSLYVQSIVTGAQLAAEIQAGSHIIQSGLVAVEGGTYEMGATKGSETLRNSRPAHLVTVDSFSMGKTRVGPKEYEKWVSRLGSSFKFNTFLLKFDPATGYPSVVARFRVDWDERTDYRMRQVEYADRMVTEGILREFNLDGDIDEGDTKHFQVVKISDTLPGSQSSDDRITRGAYYLGKPFEEPQLQVNWYASVVYALMHGARLATEGEWEFAVTERGQMKEAVRAEKFIERKEDRIYRIQKGAGWPVSLKEVDESGYPKLGIEGMLNGRSGEWVMDRYGPYSKESQTNPLGPVLGDERVVRGNGGNLFAAHLPKFQQVECRYGFSPEYFSEYKNHSLGFRLVVPQNSKKDD